MSGPRGGLDDMLPVPDLTDGPISDPDGLADALTALVAWVRQHPGRLPVTDLSDLARTAMRLYGLMAMAEPHLQHTSRAAVRAVRSWRQLTVLTAGRHRALVPATSHLTHYADQFLRAADLGAAAGDSREPAAVAAGTGPRRGATG